MKKFIFLGFLLLLVIAGIFLNYHGVFKKPVIVEKEMGPFYLVYEEHRGAYKNIGPVMDKVYQTLVSEEQIQPTRSMGIYYDNPQTTAEADLKSLGGYLIEDNNLEQLPFLQDKYQVKKIESGQFMVLEFPYQDKFSIIAGTMIAYPAINKYIVEHGYQPRETMEIYDLPNGKIIYLMGL